MGCFADTRKKKQRIRTNDDDNTGIEPGSPDYRSETQVRFLAESHFPSCVDLR